MFLRTSKASMVTTIFLLLLSSSVSLSFPYFTVPRKVYMLPKKENFIFPPLTQIILPTASGHHPSVFVHLTPSMARFPPEIKLRGEAERKAKIK